MSSSEYNPEGVRKKLEDLDHEVNTFIQVIKEVKEMKDSAGELQERLVRHEGELEQKKKELGQLISATNNLGIMIEEQTKGVIFDLEMKTDALVREVKSGISQLGAICDRGSEQLQETHKETVQSLSDKYEEVKKAYETLKIMVDAHEYKMKDLNSGRTEATQVYDKMETSINDLKKTVFEMQKRPNESDYKLAKMEERLELLINEKYTKQKNITMAVIIMLIVFIFLSIINFYFS